MNRKTAVPIVLIVLLLSSLTALAQAPAAKALPNVVILATGGTIAGAQPKEGDPGYKSGALSIESLVAAAPGLDKLANVTGEQIASIGSQDMNDEVWFKLARRANELLAKPEIAGIVVTHGTDTLEETAYFLDLVIKSDKPVVLVGSMRPATSTSPDGPLNLYNGVALAADPASKGRGVLVSANDDIHSGRDITKTNTTDVQTFVSPERGILGEIYYGKATFFNMPTTRNTAKSEFSLDGLDSLPRVDIIPSYENADGALVKASVAAGAKGIVLAGVGDGNGTKPLIDALAEAAKQGVVVVRSSRVGSGIIRRNIELNDDVMGFVAAMEMNPWKARVLLRLGLTKTKDVKDIQRMFVEY
jgi:L-asparaginase